MSYVSTPQSSHRTVRGCLRWRKKTASPPLTVWNLREGAPPRRRGRGGQRGEEAAGRGRERAAASVPVHGRRRLGGLALRHSPSPSQGNAAVAGAVGLHIGKSLPTGRADRRAAVPLGEADLCRSAEIVQRCSLLAAQN